MPDPAHRRANGLALAVAAVLLAGAARWLPGVIDTERVRHPDCMSGYRIEGC